MVLIKAVPNIEKAKSMYSMAITTLDMISSIDKKRFPSNIIKQYHEILQELAGTLMQLDGYKCIGDSAHKETIEYVKEHYRKFNPQQLHLINELRIIRNKISYEGFFVDYDFLLRIEKDILLIIEIFKTLIKDKLT